jgi:hypothetical protein
MTERTEFTVAHVADDGRITVHRDRFAKTWPDETAIEDVQIEKAGAAWQLVISAVEKAGTGVTYNIPVEFTPDGEIRTRLIPKGGEAADDEAKKDAAVNKCIGHSCSRCTWSGASCSCSIGSGSCDHELIVSFSADPVFLKE